MRAPDFIIGSRDNPYLHRWYVIPRNMRFNIYLHHFLRSDDDRALHDHPWWNISFLLSGRYIEVTPKGRFLRKRFAVVFRRATASHRVELIDGPLWTLFITGPKVREWDFWCPRGWRHWRDFVSNTPGGNEIGRGCND